MTKFLLVCDHHRMIVIAPTLQDAFMQFKCKRCAMFDMKESKWKFRDIRAYTPTEADIKACAELPSQPTKRKKPAIDQTDWIEMQL